MVMMVHLGPTQLSLNCWRLIATQVPFSWAVQSSFLHLPTCQQGVCLSPVSSDQLAHTVMRLSPIAT